MNPTDETVVNLFWTGGWDSTFRLLELLLDYGLETQPYYLIDPSRPSTRMELAAIAAMKGQILSDYPHTESLFRPIEVIMVSEIPHNQQIESWHSDLQERFPRLGNQYDWLARFAASRGLNDLELCVVKYDVGLVSTLMRKSAELKSDEKSGLEYYQVVNFEKIPEMKLFSAFRLPTLGITKAEMGEKAVHSGREHIMQMTWFCHTPRRKSPCGSCGPCRATADQGNRERIGLYNRTIRRRVFRPSRLLWGQFKEFLRPRRRLRTLRRRFGFERNS